MGRPRGVPPVRPQSHGHPPPRSRQTPRPNESRPRPARVFPAGPDEPQMLINLIREIEAGECVDVRRYCGDARSLEQTVLSMNDFNFRPVGTQIQFPDTVLGIVHARGVLMAYIAADRFWHTAPTDRLSHLINTASELLTVWHNIRDDRSEANPGPAKAFHIRAYSGDHPVIEESHTLMERMFGERGLRVHEFPYHACLHDMNCVRITWKGRPSPKLCTSTGYTLAPAKGVSARPGMS